MHLTRLKFKVCVRSLYAERPLYIEQPPLFPLAIYTTHEEDHVFFQVPVSNMKI